MFYFCSHKVNWTFAGCRAVQKKTGPGAEGEQRQGRLKEGHLSLRTGVQRGSRPQSFRNYFARIGAALAS